jgi:Flp pilus assembly protein TadG
MQILLFKKIRNLSANEKGGILVFVSLCLIPLLLVMGLGIDSATGLEQKRQLQAAINAAVNAGIANGNGNTATIQSEAQKVFAANTANMTNISPLTVTVNTSNNTVSGSATVTVNNKFMSLGGFSTSTYNAAISLPLVSSVAAEISIVYEATARMASNGFHQNVVSGLTNFVNSLPSNVMVSVTPIATELNLTSSSISPSCLYNNMSTTTNDESAVPALYPMSPSFTWNSTNYNTCVHPFYSCGNYAQKTTDPGCLLSNPSSGQYQNWWGNYQNNQWNNNQNQWSNYQSCAPTAYPNKCPGTNNYSCSQYYSYSSNNAYPVQPLTRNKTTLGNYLKGLKSFTPTSDGCFHSLISWGWRQIDPNWSSCWQTNSSPTATTTSTGTHPKPYGSVYKAVIFISNGTPYWNDYSTRVSNNYKNMCQNLPSGGLNYWQMTAYGVIPVPTDYVNNRFDQTCENRWYNTVDNCLGLKLTDNTNVNATCNSSSYPTNVLNEVRNKFFRICNNIKSNNVDVYVISGNDISSLAPACNTPTNAYPVLNNSLSIAAAFQGVHSTIVSKCGSGGG